MASGGSSRLTECIVTRVSDSLVQLCLDRGSTDNISVILVTFPALEQSCRAATSTTPAPDLSSIGGTDVTERELEGVARALLYSGDDEVKSENRSPAITESVKNAPGPTPPITGLEQQEQVHVQEQEQELEPSPPPVNVIKVMAEMNKDLPPSSPMRGTRLF